MQVATIYGRILAVEREQSDIERLHRVSRVACLGTIFREIY